MEKITGTSIGSFILGAILLFLPALVGAKGPVPVTVHCTGANGGPLLASKLAAGAAAANRTLFVTGDCYENVTVRNLRVIIDGTGGGTLFPLDATKAAITFRGGTTEAVIQGMIIHTGANPANPDVSGTACNTDGNTLKGGDGIDVRDGANVTIGQAAAFDVPAHTAVNGANIIDVPAVSAIGNVIHVNGAGRGIRVRNGANATLNANTINGNLLRVDFTTVDVKCVGTLAKSFKGSVGIDVSSAAIAALGTQVSQTADAVVGGGTIDNRNTVTGHDTGLNCAQGTVTGIKASTSIAPTATGVSLITGNQTANVTLAAPTVGSQALYNKNCFTDE